jgi:hypothetical protein
VALGLLLTCGCSQILGIGDFHVGDGGTTSDAHVLGQAAYVKASNTNTGDHFGHVAISADGSTIAIGANLEDSGATMIDGNQNDETKLDSGAVYVFTRAGASWSQQAYIKADNTDANDQFGSAVALSADGNTLVVGAPLEDSAAVGVGGNEALNTSIDSGATYVFSRTGTTWTKAAYLKGFTAVAGDNFGTVVAVSGDGLEIAVGAPLHDTTGPAVSAAGGVFTYHYTGTAWAVDTAVVVASTPGAMNEFGYAVALSTDGMTMAVGSPFEDSASTGINGNQTNTNAMDAGAVYTFTRSGTAWTQQAYVKSTATAAMDKFGTAVALAGDGNTLAVGAPHDSNATGAVYVYARSGSAWSAAGSVVASNKEAGDAFGDRVALSADGMLLAVTAPTEDSGGQPTDNSVMDSGALYSFSRNGTMYTTGAYLKAKSPSAGDQLDSVGTGGGAIVVGALFEDSMATGVDNDAANDGAMDSGAAYVFE